MMLRRLALAAVLALSPSLALAQVNNQDFSIAAYVRNVLSGNVVIGGNLTVGGILFDTGGIAVNSPTGGNKGAGTINVAADYYKNGTIIPETVSLPLALSAGGNVSCPTCVLISGTAHGDSAYAILSTDRYVYTNAAFTLPRIWTLPAANSLAAGTTIWVQDAQGTVTTTNTLTIQRAGADTVNVTGTNVVMTGAGGGTQFTTDGVSNWGTAVQTVSTGGTGRQTLTNHGLLVGAGTNPLTQLGVATTGQLLFGVTGADPAFSSTGTGVATALGVNVGAAGAFVVNGGALGTPSSGTLTNATGLPLSTGVTGTLTAAAEPAHTGDATNSAGSLAMTVPKVNGVAYGASPSTNTVPVVTGANTVTYEAVPNAALANAATTVAGQTCTLGSTCGLSNLQNTIGGDVALNNTASYFDGPSVAQGVTGTWYASGTVLPTGNLSDVIVCKLWDGTTIKSSGIFQQAGSSLAKTSVIALSGIFTAPAGNIRISCRDVTSTSGVIAQSDGLNPTASTVSVVRIQ